MAVSKFKQRVSHNPGPVGQKDAKNSPKPSSAKPYEDSPEKHRTGSIDINAKGGTPTNSNNISDFLISKFGYKGGAQNILRLQVFQSSRISSRYG